MNTGNFSPNGRKDLLLVLRVAAILVVGGILVFGLWPFHAPRNQVTWSKDPPGVVVGWHGSLRSEGEIKSKSKPGGPCAIIIRLEPRHVDYGGAILSVYRPQTQVSQFEIRQFVSGLELRRTDKRGAEPTTFHLDRVFTRAGVTSLLISSGPGGTKIYLDGALPAKSDTFKFSSDDLSGEIILGNNPTGGNNWLGRIHGLAIYDRELAPEEVAQDFAGRGSSRNADLLQSGLIASYPFVEGSGGIVHNLVSSAPNIVIPNHYFVVQKTFLELPWHDFHASWSYWLDCSINIAGFIPLGLVLRAYFSEAGIKRSTLLSIFFGFALSLSIEVLQAFLPTRDSDVNDLINNTLGTALGAGFAWKFKTRMGSWGRRISRVLVFVRGREISS